MGLTNYNSDNLCRWDQVNVTQIRLGDTMVTPTDSVTNLGVIVDENLFMDKHIAKAVCVSIKNIIMI